MKNLTTPISENDINNLNINEKITISGTIYTGRDAALPQLVKLIKQDKVPFDLKGSVIMHTAYSEAGIAPTTSSKEEIESTIPVLSENGVKIHIGKGKLSDKTVKSLKEVIKKECILFENEGMEAMYKLKVEKIPGIVAIQDGKII